MGIRLKLFWISSLFSNIALAIYAVSFSWLTVKTYGAMGVSMVTFGYAVPQILLVLFGGLASDSINKQTLFRVCQLLFLIGGVVLVLTSLSSAPSLWLLVAISTANGSISAFSFPAQTSLLSTVVPPSEVSKIQQIFFVASGLGWVFGPMIAGHLLPIQNFIISNAHGSLAFLIYTIFLAPLILFTPKTTGPSINQSQALSAKSRVMSAFLDIRKSLLYLRTTTDIRTLMRTLALLLVLGGTFVSLLSIYAHDHPSAHHSSTIFSRLYAAVGVGHLLGSLLGVYFAEYSKQKAAFVVYLIFGLCLAALSALLASSYWEIALSIILIGLFSSVCIHLLKGLIQSHVEPDMYGRIAGFTQLLTGVSSLFASGAGFVIHYLSNGGLHPYAAFEYVQMGMFGLLALLTLVNLPSLRRVQYSI